MCVCACVCDVCVCGICVCMCVVCVSVSVCVWVCVCVVRGLSMCVWSGAGGNASQVMRVEDKEQLCGVCSSLWAEEQAQIIRLTHKCFCPLKHISSLCDFSGQFVFVRGGNNLQSFSNDLVPEENPRKKSFGGIKFWGLFGLFVSFLCNRRIIIGQIWDLWLFLMPPVPLGIVYFSTVCGCLPNAAP